MPAMLLRLRAQSIAGMARSYKKTAGVVPRATDLSMFVRDVWRQQTP